MDNPPYQGSILFVGYDSIGAVSSLSERQIIAESTAGDALERIQKEDVDCIVSDYHLTDGTGIDLLELVREDYSDLPFLLWTNDGDETIASNAISAGVSEYIIRDADPDDPEITRLLTRCGELIETTTGAGTGEYHFTLTNVLETCPVGLTVVNAEGKIIRANDRAVEVLGMSPVEMNYRRHGDWSTRFTDESGDTIAVEDLPARRVHRTGSPVYGELIGIHRPHGENVWVLMNSVPLSGSTEARSDPLVINAFVDITEFRQYQHLIEDSERKFRAVFEEAFDAMLIADDNSQYVDVNPAACDLFGLSREELLGRRIEEFADGDYDFEAAWSSFLESDKDRGEFPLVRADGEKRTVEFAATPNILPGRHLSVLRDVTERKETRKQLQTERDRAQRYLDTAGVMMIALDADGSVTLVNERACELLGLEEAEIVGKDWFDTFVPKTDRRETRAGFDRLMSGDVEAVEDFENPILTADGEKRIIKWYNTVRRTDEGDIIGTLSSGTDITERRRYEETLRALYDSTHDLLGAESKVEASEIVVDTVSNILDISGVVMYLYDESEDLLYPAAQSVETEFMREKFPAVPPDDSSITGHVYRTGEIARYNDITESPYLQTTETNMRAGVFVPIEDHGILIVGSRDIGAFGDRTKQLMELLGTNAVSVLDRLDQFHRVEERERQLKASEQKFRSLVEATPDPIFVADAETGEIVETNSAACAIRKQSREDIIGLHQMDLHPENESQQYEALFERHVEAGRTGSRLPDGSQIQLTTANGERVPVSISSRRVKLEDRTLIHGIYRDISERIRYERSLEELNRAVRDFIAADTDHEIANTTVRIAEDVIDVSGVAVYFYDDERGVLSPVAYSSGLEQLVGKVPDFTPGESIAWRVYANQEQEVFDDVRTDDEIYNPGTPIRSELICPLGEHGVVIAGDTASGMYDELTVDLMEIVASTAETALDRIEWAQDLHEQKNASKIQAEKLERVNQLNGKIRSIIRGVIQADTREEIEHAVCDHLLDIDRFSFAWIGEPDYVTDSLTTRASAGSDDGYLETLSLEIDADHREPTLTCSQQGETILIENIPSSLQDEPWRKDALLAGFKSMISVPLLHDDILYGVLSIYAAGPGAFDDLSVGTLSELGHLIGYSLDSVEHRNALLNPDVVDLTFELPGHDGAFTDLADNLGCDLDIRQVTSRRDGTYLVHVLANDIEPESFNEIATGIPIIDEIRSIDDPDPVSFELVVSGDSIVTRMDQFGILSLRLTISDSGTRASVSIPQTQDVASFTERFLDAHPDANLIARHGAEREQSPQGLSALLEQLTQRQREILSTAYYAGYFEQPRTSTGADIANSLGISQPAFSKQLRSSQRNLLTPIFDPDSITFSRSD